MTPETIAGKYQLLRKLGQGGMAEVYLAKQTGQGGFEKLVVIKRILPGFIENREFATMFMDEARTAADLRHPNVVNIFETGEDRGSLYMVMEFLHGQDIRRIQREVAAKTGEIPLHHSCQIVLDAASGLHYAHTKTDLRGNALSIIHRDVSPQNILVTYDGATKIVDFGIAKAASQDTNTATGIIKGKYTYMSPEQAQGQVIDPRSDQYALGIVFWELLTMRRLFKRENEIMTLNAIVDGDVPSPRVYRPDLPEHLEHIVLQCLAKEPEDRFDSCEDLMLELEEFLADEGLVHSPARLGQYMRGLFAESIAQEAAQGFDDPALADALVAGEATQRGRRGSSKNRVVPSVAGDSPVEPGAATAISRSRGSTPSPAELDLDNEPTHISQEIAAGGLELEHTIATPSRVVAIQEPTIALSGNPSQLPQHAPAPRRSMMLVSAMVLSVLLAGLAGSLFFFASPTTGSLTVQSSPSFAVVLLDGVDTGRKTPTQFANLQPGRYRVGLALPGYQTLETDAVVAADAEVKLSPTLSPAADGEAGSDAADTGAEADAGRGAPRGGRDAVVTVQEPRDAGAETRAKRGGEGRPARGAAKTKPARLRIVVKPWGEVFVDGKRQGITPLKPLRLPPGTYKIRLKNEELGKDVTKTVKLASGEDRLIKQQW